MSATVDGGDLAWGLTQVSAGVKIVDHKAKDPITGGLPFGASGHEKVQFRNNCYPLYIFIAKDNKELYHLVKTVYGWSIHTCRATTVM